LSADAVLARLASVPTTDLALQPLLRGDPRPGVIGSVRGGQFCLQNSFVLPRYHDVRAYGTVRPLDPLRSAISVEFRRSTLSKWAVWIMWLLGLLLVGSALLAATQKPVFLFFAAFTAAGAGLLIWSTRQPAEDQERLRAFMIRLFPEATWQ
jgi:hypothetical protein